MFKKKYALYCRGYNCKEAFAYRTKKQLEAFKEGSGMYCPKCGDILSFLPVRTIVIPRPKAPEPKKPQEIMEPTVLYLCDQRACERCSAMLEECHHTTDITHAEHFQRMPDGSFIER